MGPHLLIRVDSGPEVGLGHAMRMIALAEAWKEAGGAVTFTGRLPERARMTGEVVAPADAGGTRALAERLHAAWVVADGYTFGEQWQRALEGVKLLALYAIIGVSFYVMG